MTAVHPPTTPTPGAEVQIQYAPESDVVALRIRPHLAIAWTEVTLPADTLVVAGAQITLARAQVKQQHAASGPPAPSKPALALVRPH